MRARPTYAAQLGEAISIEDALSMLTVIFVLFVIFLVPLVTIDRMQLEKEQSDPFWKVVVASFDHPAVTLSAAKPYELAFDLDDAVSVRVEENPRHGVRYVEALLRDSSVAVVQHNRADNTFTALYCQGEGATQIFQSGTLTWNPSSGRWVVFDFHIDYGQAPGSKQMQKEYREWFAARAERKQGNS